VLAGGIAHDFNNCLTAVLGNLDIASQCTPEARTAMALDRAKNACDTARQLALKLLTFSAGGEPMRKPVRVEDLVREIVPPMLAGTAVRLELSLAAGLERILADPDQIAQLLRNIVSNSLEAMGSRGILRISSSNLDSDGTTQIPEGRFVQISIADTGPGISQEDIGRIFEPYFTRKPDGQGLGLTACFSIVRKHGGQIEALTGPGGAEIIVWLPVAEKSLPADARGATARAVDLSGRRALVMDDDPLVLETFLEMLKSMGIEAAGARDGSEAVQLFLEAERTRKPWDLMILDLVVPGGMGGLEALARIRKASSSARAIVSSGYSADAVLSEYREHGFDGALRKPFTLSELRAALESALG
jgi:CheY-like chemotaxis protein